MPCAVVWDDPNTDRRDACMIAHCTMRSTDSTISELLTPPPLHTMHQSPLCSTPHPCSLAVCLVTLLTVRFTCSDDHLPCTPNTFV